MISSIGVITRSLASFFRVRSLAVDMWEGRFDSILNRSGMAL